MAKSAIYTTNTTSQAMAVGSAISPGTVIRRFGQNLTLVGDAINVNGAGYYSINASFILTATNAGTVSITLVKDGVAIPGAVASATLAVGDVATISINSLIREFGCCCDNNSNISFILSGTAETVSNVSIVAERI